MMRLRPDELANEFDRLAESFRVESVSAAHADDEMRCTCAAGQASMSTMLAQALRNSLTDTPDERRERFESWIRSRYPTAAAVLLEIRDGEYWHSFTHAAYMGWTMAGAFIPNSEEKS